ncbi:hypothetical protein SAMN05444008_12039 [Cnuella takakiae]|uniref:Uncharacterized protein n=1 Tax=Cnuella takakiae TaxID=1302690 RepID=A0A1M5HSQ3_9BACT|nr:hypothetical protein SAMN05444008_12039 [Cnuella takakiae]
MLTHFSEDTFGDKVSWCSIFSLKENRSQELKNLMHPGVPPDVAAFLQKDELFFNIVCSKETGYFDSLLIKSPEDIERSLLSLQAIPYPVIR